MIKKDLVIVGAGPAGMAAAISAYRNGVKDILIIERDDCLGGILNQCIHTGFGLTFFNEILSGPEYADRVIKDFSEIPVEVSLKSFAVKLNLKKEVTFLRPGKLETVKAKALIMATGCRERTREMVHIAGTRPAGIFSAGLAQKLINIDGLLPGERVVIVGSGDIGLIMARRFTLEGAKVEAVIEIQTKSRGLLRNLVQCLDDFSIPIYYRHRVKSILGKDRVCAVKIVAVDDALSDIFGTEKEISCDTVLMSVGLIPENDLIESAGVVLDRKTNTPLSKGLNKTEVPGLFVCGNAFKIYDLVDEVSYDSQKAGAAAADYLKDGRW